jgi:hypothetical protein
MVFIRQDPSHIYTQECNPVAVKKNNAPIVMIPLLVHKTECYQEEPTVPKYKCKYNWWQASQCKEICLTK